MEWIKWVRKLKHEKLYQAGTKRLSVAMPEKNDTARKKPALTLMKCI
jgi:hypothetical protein